MKNHSTPTDENERPGKASDFSQLLSSLFKKKSHTSILGMMKNHSTPTDETVRWEVSDLSQLLSSLLKPTGSCASFPQAVVDLCIL